MVVGKCWSKTLLMMILGMWDTKLSGNINIVHRTKYVVNTLKSLSVLNVLYTHPF